MRSSTWVVLIIAASSAGAACAGDDAAGVELPGLAGAPLDVDVEGPPPLPTSSAPTGAADGDNPGTDGGDEDGDDGGDDDTDADVTVSSVAVTESTVVDAAASEPADPAVDEPAVDVFLRRGDSGPEVASMQRLLVTLGYLAAGGDSGTFDGATADALIDFQAQYGLVVDGIFGPESDRALRAAAASVEAG